MALRLKDSVSPERLKEFGFHRAEDDFKTELWCGDGMGAHKDWWYKFLTVDPETYEYGEGYDDIAYAEDSMNPMVQLIFRIGSGNDLWIDCTPSETYHIEGDEVDIVADTIYDLVDSGIVEKFDRM